MLGPRLTAQVGAVARTHAPHAPSRIRAVGPRPTMLIDARACVFDRKRRSAVTCLARAVLPAVGLTARDRLVAERISSPNQAFHDSIRATRVIMP